MCYDNNTLRESSLANALQGQVGLWLGWRQSLTISFRELFNGLAIALSDELFRVDF